MASNADAISAPGMAGLPPAILADVADCLSLDVTVAFATACAATHAAAIHASTCRKVLGHQLVAAKSNRKAAIVDPRVALHVLKRARRSLLVVDLSAKDVSVGVFASEEFPYGPTLYGKPRRSPAFVALLDFIQSAKFHESTSAQLSVLRVHLPLQWPAFRFDAAWHRSLTELSLHVDAGMPSEESATVGQWLGAVSACRALTSLSLVTSTGLEQQPVRAASYAEAQCDLPLGLRRLFLGGMYVDRHLRAGVQRLPKLEILTLWQCFVPKLFEVFERCAFHGTLRHLRLHATVAFAQYGQRHIDAIAHNLRTCLETLLIPYAFWFIGDASALIDMSALKSVTFGGADAEDLEDGGDTFEALVQRGVAVSDDCYGVFGRDVLTAAAASDGGMDT